MAKKTSKVAKKTVDKTEKVKEVPVVHTTEPNQREIFVAKREAARQRTFRKLRKFGKYIQVEPVYVRDISGPVRCEVCQRILIPCKDQVGSISFPDNEKFIAYQIICRRCLRDAQIASVNSDDLTKLAIEEFPKTSKELKLVKTMEGEMMPCDVCSKECGTTCHVYWNNNHTIPIKIHYCTSCFVKAQEFLEKESKQEPVTLAKVESSAQDLLNELKEV